MVLMINNGPSHTSTFVLEIAEKLNICFTPMIKYAPRFNCAGKVQNIIKDKIKLSIIRKTSELVNIAFKTFKEKI